MYEQNLTLLLAATLPFPGNLQYWLKLGSFGLKMNQYTIFIFL